MGPLPRDCAACHEALMDHAEAVKLLPAYDAGSLGREDTRALHLHFKGCDACQSRIRLRRAVSHAGPDASGPLQGLADPETQRQIARNRDLLIKILLLMVAAWAVFKWRR
jgi:hypothetical protein